MCSDKHQDQPKNKHNQNTYFTFKDEIQYKDMIY